ncbi:phosphotransferase family protein [Nakamurella lactea]|uniref:phosphotransferase family protein n=1 Tax=Nakamurella lactea TaxID=459515 RepID=UPI00048BF277|nr:phosphotransferase [Nakamurella lactea]
MPLSDNRVAEALAAGLPGYRPESVRPLDSGSDHDVYVVDGTLLIRFGRDGAGSPEPEASLLRRLGGLLTVPVPQPVFSDERTGALACRLLPGTPLLSIARDIRNEWRAGVGAALGTMLADLHQLTTDDLGGCPVDGAPPAESLADAIRSFAEISTDVPAGLRGAMADFLDSRPPPPGPKVFSHNDLGIEHVLVEPATGSITGIIDWSDAAMCDPARDFGLLLRDLGDDALERAYRSYRRTGGPIDVDQQFRTRCLFHARCALLEDWAYGRDTGRSDYIDKSRDAAAALFAP